MQAEAGGASSEKLRFRDASELSDAERLKHEAFLRVAIDAAKQEGRPFGAAIFDSSGKLLSIGINPGANSHAHHSEIVAIQAAAAAKGRRELYGCKLYVTAAPCPMCAAAIVWSCIDTVVWGTSIAKLVEMGYGQFSISCQDIAEAAPPWAGKIDMIEGLLTDETDPLFELAPLGTWRRDPAAA